jgi:O-6-methylguanine DNA methyltransferase
MPGAAATTPVRYALARCAFGSVLVATGPRGIRAILLGDRASALVRELRRRCPDAVPETAVPPLEGLLARVVRMLEAPPEQPDLPLAPGGTPFQHRVWSALRAIPAGSTASYSEIARRIGAPRAVRAVARACAANPLAVAIPCHRIVRRDGRMGGFRWGLERKRALLAREAGA